LEIAQNAIAQLRKDYDFFYAQAGGGQSNKSANCAKTICWMNRNGFQLPAKKIAEIRRRLKPPNKPEESEVYLWVEMPLNSSELANLNELIQKELDNLPPRFDDL
jgi:hypothetical protein